MAFFVYVSNSRSDYFSKFVLNPESGNLTAKTDIVLDAEPGAITGNADGTRMYLCLRNRRTYQSFAVDRKSGVLSELNRVTVPQAGPYLTTDRRNRYLLATYYGAGAVSVHGLESDGSIGRQIQWIETEKHAHSIQLDSTNRYAYVPHTNPSNAIYQFRFDERTGQLSPNDPHRIQPQTPEGPRHFVFHPGGNYLYSVNENGSTVSACKLDPDTGRLKPLQVISTLPESRDCVRNSCAEIRITRNGRFLYASNRGHESLAIFAVNADGSLDARGHQPTEAGPRFFDLDPTGKFLLCVGQRSGHLSLYRLLADGSMTRCSRHRVGESPLWIHFVKRRHAD